MSPDLIAEMARIQYSARLTESLARTQYQAAETEPRATAHRSGSLARRALATAAIVLGLGAGAVGTTNVVSSPDVAANSPSA